MVDAGGHWYRLSALPQTRCRMTGRTSWNAPPSLYATTANNPVHGFVERSDLVPNAKKKVIPLSIGDPTVFGNLLPCEEVLAPVVDSLRNPKNYGYIPCTGLPAAKEAIAEYSSNAGLKVGLEVNKFPKFASDTEFVLALFAEESVLCLPGQIFDYPNYFRIMLTVPQEMLVEALDRIVVFCKAYCTR
ncbi:uncharacterized protein [Dermacentor albipictus]|uniref:uncharacterized protein isoform X2 n=1 Tax=Dermacentor albipictus TaxID=60249 RepID=UPI0038FCDEB5